MISIYSYKECKINLIKGDITTMTTDAIVNAANNTLLGGGGVDGAIHRVGGPEILKQCKKIGGCPTGEARITIAGDLKSDYVIHTVGPKYNQSEGDVSTLLYNAYYNSLLLAKEYNLKSISFPSISTGVYGYPINEAVKIAYKAVIDFLDKENNIELINFVLFSSEDKDEYINYFNYKLKND